MSRYWNENKQDLNYGVTIRDIVIMIVILIASSMAGCPRYRVWQQGLVGKAALERAMQDRQIAVQEAQAKKESSVLLAAAEIERAKGVAEANKIIGNSLKGNDAYLRYLWIDGLKSDRSQVIYVPTEAGLPILEDGKREDELPQ
jgi:hypothetical protein